MTVNCSHGKGIQFIRDDGLFSGTGRTVKNDMGYLIYCNKLVEPFHDVFMDRKTRDMFLSFFFLKWLLRGGRRRNSQKWVWVFLKRR